jgi:hypothetical protein
VIVVPGLPPVRSGPYRVLAHPNYLAVVVEGFALPLVHGCWITAAAFTVLNAALITVRLGVGFGQVEAAGLPSFSTVEPRGRFPPPWLGKGCGSLGLGAWSGWWARRTPIHPGAGEPVVEPGGGVDVTDEAP